MATIKGGQKFERVLREIARKLSKPALLRVGFLEGATYPDKRSTSVAMIAAIQDFGAPSVGIPPRPFFRNMIKDKSPAWPKILGENLKAVDNDVDVAMDSLGSHIGGELRQSIIDTNAPPLKPATIARKGFAKPLIDSSNMINSVDHEVKTK